jgi:hypothetical protein
MPKGTRVHRCYDKRRAAGDSKKKAARICQRATGQALATGRPPKKRGKR